MLKCKNCHNVYEDFPPYFYHLRYAHNITNYFPCPEEDCKRLYHSKSVLKKHFITIHNIRDKQNTTRNVLPECAEANTVKKYETDTASYCKDPKQQKSDDNFDKVVTNFDEYVSKVNDAVTTFMTELHSISSLPRNIIQSIVELVSNLIISEPFFILKNSLKDTKENFLMITALQDALSNINTDYKRTTYLKKQDTYVKPVPKTIGVSQDSRQEQGNVAMVLKNRMSYFIPLRKYLKVFLEIPDVLTTILNYQKNVAEDSILRNIVNSTSWQETKRNCENENIIPLTVYYDDFESGNPLGSHSGSQKIGAVYVTISSIPPNYSSRLEYIWPVLLFYTQDRVAFGNESTFRPLLEELNFLYKEGISVKCGHSATVTVKFALGIMSGDNLGLNSILGFHESFSSNNFCRICTTPKAQTKVDTNERPENIRKQNDYQAHCDNSVGIKQKCIWHALSYFHVYKNFTCDVMHDLCEGIFRYDMCLIIKHFIDLEYFDVDNLNSRIQYFTYLKNEKNKPPPVLKRHLLNGQIIFSASEMLCLVRNFRYIVGEFIPDNDPTWCLYLKLLEITDILTSQTFTSELLDYLKPLLESYMENLIEIFSCSLKPKHHFLLHYSRIIPMLGPPILASAFKFETKHRELKKIAQSMANRKNLPLTLATKHQLTIFQRLRSGLRDRIIYGKKLKHDDTSNFYDKDVFDCVVFVEINGYHYSNMNVVLRKFEEDIPVFCKIKHVLINKYDKQVYFVCTVLETLGYSSHYMAYLVCETNVTEVVHLHDCCSLTPNIIHTVKKSMYVDLRC